MSTNTANKRRHQLTEFRDLFTALFRIPDRDVQTRVLDAINGVVHGDSDKCTCKKHRKFVDVGTQTTFAPTAVIKVKRDPVVAQVQPVTQLQTIKNIVPVARPGNSSSVVQQVTNSSFHAELAVIVPQTLAVSLPDQQPTSLSANAELSGDQVKKRRKRMRIPRVEKVTEETSKVAALINEISQDSQQQQIRNMKRTHSTSAFSKAKNPRRISLESNNEHIAGLINCYSEEQIDNGVKMYESSKTIIDQMKLEYAISLNSINGLLPIHNAILENDIHQLKRQIYVLKFRGINIHKLLTDDDETPLQLAIKNNSLLSIVNELLINDADTNESDKDSNTVIHLAMMYSENTKLLRLLLDQINIDILELFNDNGNTALHVGVSEEKFLMCKTLLEFIDEKENIKTPGTGISDKEKLLALYKNELNVFPTKEIASINYQKGKILNAINRKNGRTPLFFALCNRLDNLTTSEVMVLMLLVHLADPKVRDYTGMDSVTFALDTYEVNRYNDALENSSIYLEKCMLQANQMFCDRNVGLNQ